VRDSSQSNAGMTVISMIEVNRECIREANGAGIGPNCSLWSYNEEKKKNRLTPQIM